MSSRIKFDGNGGRILRSNILISIRCILDLDYGLVKYCAQELPNNKIFDLSKFYDVHFLDLIKELYHRKYDNPLYYLAKPDTDKNFLDELRKEIMEERESKVLDNSVSTEIANVMDTWMHDQDIASITILYYTDEELKLLEEEPFLKKFNHISVESAKKATKKFEQYFFFEISEAENFKDVQFRSFYFSKRNLNFIETEINNKINLAFDIESSPFNDLIPNRNEIAIFDLYREDILDHEFNDEDEI